MSLYQLGGVCFVQDGHHRVSVARFHGAEWIDAEVTEFRSPGAVLAREPGADTATLSARQSA